MCGADWHAELQEFTVAMQDSLRGLGLDLRQITSYTVVPGSIVVGFVGSSAAIALIEGHAAADRITVTYLGITYRLLRRTTTTEAVSTLGRSTGPCGECCWC